MLCYAALVTVCGREKAAHEPPQLQRPQPDI